MKNIFDVFNNYTKDLYGVHDRQPLNQKQKKNNKAKRRQANKSRNKNRK